MSGVLVRVLLRNRTECVYICLSIYLCIYVLRDFKELAKVIVEGLGKSKICQPRIPGKSFNWNQRHFPDRTPSCLREIDPLGSMFYLNPIFIFRIIN